MVVSTTVLARATTQRGPLLRNSARPGDLVCVTGQIGASFESGWHLEFEPRVEEAIWLSEQLGDGLHAMIDISDGLGRDAGRIALASGVRIEIDLDAIPLRDAKRDPLQAVGDGEDYELLFTIDPSSKLSSMCAEAGTPLSVIGRVVEGAGCVGLREGDGPIDLTEAGWDHA
jgi:thiamine-monophosphate kinase